MNSTWTIPAAPERVDNIAQAVTLNAAGRTHTFIKTSDGRVYRLMPRRALDLSEQWESNVTVRRAVCKLTGQKMADLESAIKKQRDRSLAREKKRQIDRLRSRAGVYGYRLVKVKAPA